MARKFSQLRSKMSPERREANLKAALDLLAEMPLHQLRKARDFTQEQMAATLGIPQPSVSKLERRADMYIRTLRRYLEAMGAELRRHARA